MDLPPLLTRTAMRASGYSDAELRRMLRSKDLTSVRRGRYLRGSPPTDLGVRHALAAQAALTHLADGAVCSHVTAAILHGLPVWRIPASRVHVTRASNRSGSRANARVHVHAAPLRPDEICLVAGMPVTDLARTVVDLARTVPFEPAVAVADAALAGSDSQPKRAPVTRDALAAALARVDRWPGSRSARRVIAFADGGSGGVGESRSRVAMADAGLPTPVLQWKVSDPDGRFIGYADFGWPELCTVGEFDGRIKYGRILRPGQEPGDVVFAEKIREDRMRDQHLAVVRWTWADLTDFAPVVDNLRSRFRR